MRILVAITRGDTIGGSQQHVVDLTTGLLARGHDTVVLSGPGDALAQRLEEAGVPHTSVPELDPSFRRPRDDFQALAYFRKAIREFMPDTMSLHSTKAGLVGRLAARLERCPAVYTVHGSTHSPGVPTQRRIAGLAMEHAMRPFTDQVITVSDFDRSHAIAKRVVPKNRVAMIRNAVPDVRATEPATIDDSVVRLGMVARLDHQKNHRDLLEGLANLRSLDWALDLIGDGPLQAELEQQARDLHISDRVKFVGLVDDVPQRLANLDILALITHYEGLPISLIEGLRAGLPLIASDVGGNMEVVYDNKNGFLTAPSDVSQLTAVLDRCISDAPLRERFARESRNIFEQQFSFERFLDRTISVHEQVAESRSRARLIAFSSNRADERTAP